ncbi:Proteasome subunit alpha type-3 [Sparganum proliferum]
MSSIGTGYDLSASQFSPEGKVFQIEYAYKAVDNSGAIRPFGVSLLLGSYEQDGAHLYVVEPSGISYAYEGCAIGKAKQNAKTELEQLKLKDMTIQELIKEAAKIIYTVHDEIKDKTFELNLSWIGAPTNAQHELVPQDVFTQAEEYAKKALEEADDLDEEME